MATNTSNSRTGKSSNTPKLEPVEPNYFTVTFNTQYGESLLVPASKINALMDVLSTVEVLSHRYNQDKTRVDPIRRDLFAIDSISAKELMDRKMAQLLDIPYEEYKEEVA